MCHGETVKPSYSIMKIILGLLRPLIEMVTNENRIMHSAIACLLLIFALLPAPVPAQSEETPVVSEQKSPASQNVIPEATAADRATDQNQSLVTIMEPGTFVFPKLSQTNLEYTDIEQTTVFQKDILKWIILILVILALALWLRSRTGDREEGKKQQSRKALGLLLLAILLGSVMLLQECGNGDNNNQDTTRTRSRRGNCSLGAEFAIRLVPDGGSVSPSPNALMSELDSGVFVDSTVDVQIRVRDVAVDPYPGTISFTFFRGASGNQLVTGFSDHIVNAASLQNFLNRPPPQLSVPNGVNLQHQTATERIRAIISYVPDGDVNACTPVRGEATINWRLARSNRSYTWKFPDSFHTRRRISVPGSGSRVTAGGDIIDETTGFTGRVNKATHTRIHFHVDQPFSCCEQSNTCHTIIQFVRHRWRVGGENEPTTIDQWNLDGPESQSTRHSQGQDYDPTFTSDPHHGGNTSDEDNELVSVGPWDGRGGTAVIVDDFPGLLDSDHERLKRRGGIMEWEFITLLVCRADTGTAAAYLQNSKVRAIQHFIVRRTYPGNNNEPVVQWGNNPPYNDPTVNAESFNPCRPLNNILTGLQLLNAFNNPRPHALNLGSD